MKNMKKWFIVLVLFKSNFLLTMDNPIVNTFSKSQQCQAMQLHCKASLVQFSPTNKKLITLESDVSIWDIESGLKLFCCDPEMGVSAVELNKDETQLFLINQNGQRSCWDIANNKLLWKGESIPNLYDACIIFNDDKSKILARNWYKAALIDALTGKQEAFLWECCDLKNNIITADFYKDSSKVFVFHNGLLTHESNEMVAYTDLVPETADSVVYLRQHNKLVYFTSDHYVILDLGVKKEIRGKLMVRSGAAYRTIKPIEEGCKLLYISFSGVRGKGFREHCSFVDVYDMQTPSLIMSIVGNSQPNIITFNSAKNILLLALKDKLQLWDIVTKSMVWCLKHKGWLRSVAINDQGDKILIADQDAHVAMWQKQNW